MTYSDSWPVNGHALVEFTHLVVSIRMVASRFSSRHPGLKTRVQATLDLSESEFRAVENGETPFYNARLEEELGEYVDLELILTPCEAPSISLGPSLSPIPMPSSLCPGLTIIDHRRFCFPEEPWMS